MSKQATLIGTSSGSGSAPRDDTGDGRTDHLGGEAGRWSAEPAVRVGSRVGTRDGHAGRVSRLLRDPQSQRVTHLVVRTRPLFGHELIVPVESATNRCGGSILLDVGREELDKLPVYRRDDELGGDVEAILRKDDLLRRLDLPALRVEVRDGVVTLRGHVVNRSHLARAEEAARRVRGVRELRSELVADDDLEARVAQALAGDSRTRPYFIQVHAFQGVVHLVGTLQGTTPSVETQETAQEVAANVAGVRFAVGELFGLSTNAQRLPFLPQVGLPVFAADGELGRLEAVVMSPRTRRVTHLVVAGRCLLAGKDGSTLGPELAMRRLLVPAQAVAHSMADVIHLSVDRATASQLPECREDEYVVPDPGWQPTFDYRREDVRFAVEASVHQLTAATVESIAA